MIQMWMLSTVSLPPCPLTSTPQGFNIQNITDIHWILSRPGLVISNGTLVPYNAQATLHSKEVIISCMFVLKGIYPNRMTIDSWNFVVQVPFLMSEKTIRHFLVCYSQFLFMAESLIFGAPTSHRSPSSWLPLICYFYLSWTLSNNVFVQRAYVEEYFVSRSFEISFPIMNWIRIKQEGLCSEDTCGGSNDL